MNTHGYRCEPISLDEMMPIDVLYQSDDFIVLNKLPDVRMDGENSVCTVEKCLRKSYPDFVFKWVHQLDYATSGVLLVAKHKDAAVIGSHAFKRRETRKEYLAVVKGWVDLGEDSFTDHTCSLPLPKYRSQCTNNIPSELKKYQPMNLYPQRLITTIKTENAHKLKQAVLKGKSNKILPTDIHLERSFAVLTRVYTEYRRVTAACIASDQDIFDDMVMMQLVNHSDKSAENDELLLFFKKHAPLPLPAPFCSGCVSTPSDGDGASFAQFIIELKLLIVHSKETYKSNKKLRKQLHKFVRCYCHTYGDHTSIPIGECSAASSNTSSSNDSDKDDVAVYPSITKNNNTQYPPRYYRIPSNSSSDNRDNSNNSDNISLLKYDVIVNLPIADPPQEENTQSDKNQNSFLMFPGRRKDEFMLSQSGNNDSSTISNPTLLPIGREAETRLRVLEYGYYKVPNPSATNGLDRDTVIPITKVRLFPISGRRHQLRIHCKAINHPILGDIAYNAVYDPCSPHIPSPTLSTDTIHNTVSNSSIVSSSNISTSTATSNNTNVHINNDNDITTTDFLQGENVMKKARSIDYTTSGVTQRDPGYLESSVHRMMLHAHSLYFPIPDVCCEDGDVCATTTATNDTVQPLSDNLPPPPVHRGTGTETENRSGRDGMTSNQMKREYADYSCKLLEPPDKYFPITSKTTHSYHTPINTIETTTPLFAPSSSITELSPPSVASTRICNYSFDIRSTDPFPFTSVYKMHSDGDNSDSDNNDSTSTSGGDKLPFLTPLLPAYCTSGI